MFPTTGEVDMFPTTRVSNSIAAPLAETVAPVSQKHPNCLNHTFLTCKMNKHGKKEKILQICYLYYP